MTSPSFTLENPTMPLAYVLSEHRDAFFSFLLNGNTKPMTKDRMMTAIDLVVGMIADDTGLPVGMAQYHINSGTKSGVQNLYVARFMCELLK